VFAKEHQTTENYKSYYSSTASTTYKAGKIRTLLAKKRKKIYATLKSVKLQNSKNYQIYGRKPAF